MSKDYFYGKTERVVPAQQRPWWLELLIIIGGAMALAIIISSLSGCATAQVPPCGKWGYTPVEFNGERAVLLDREDLAKLKRLISGLAEGKCRLPPDGPDA